MAQVNYGVCDKCRERVPVTHEFRDGKAYLNKICPVCGSMSALVSSDAKTYQAKRELCGFDPVTADSCNLHCTSCNRQGSHGMRLVFLDVTNHCNMNCPICIANIKSMGFVFNPPIAYFEKVLDNLAKRDPLPEVLLFGGEPTMRKDLFELIKMVRSRGMLCGVVTNGIKLANEDYCKKICDSGARVLLGFDGRSPEIYAKMRKSANVYEKKIKALENLKKYSKCKHTIMCCVARGINDKYMRDLVNFAHENRSFIGKMHLLPLTETWEKGAFETVEPTNIEEVEKIIKEAFPGEPVGFVPLGVGGEFSPLISFLGKPRSTFSGVHPNCESITSFVSDGLRYRPLGYFLNRPMEEAAKELVDLTRKIAPRLAKLDPRQPWQRLRGQLLIIRTFFGAALRLVNGKTAFKGNRYLGTMKFIGGLLTGNSLKDQLRKHTYYGESIEMIVLPFEEENSLEGDRLCRCKAGFAYEDPDDGQIKTVPVCGWWLFRTNMEKRIAEKYAKTSPEETETELVGVE